MIFVFTCETKDLRYLQRPPLVLANAPQGSIRKSFTVIVSLSSHTYFSFFLVVGLEFHLNSLYSTYIQSFISELPCVIYEYTLRQEYTFQWFLKYCYDNSNVAFGRYSCNGYHAIAQNTCRVDRVKRSTVCLLI